MNPFLLVPLLLGSLVVFQPVLNSLILEQKGLALTAWLNSLVLVSVASLSLWLCYQLGDRLPALMRPQWDGEWRWWYVLPGLMGFSLVVSVPLAIRTLGAFPTIVALLVGQLLTSLIYDAIAASRPITLSRIFGLLLTLGGAYLSFRRPQ